MIAKRQLDRVGLIDVAERGRRPVRIEVLDLVGIDAAVAQRRLHRALGAVDVRGGHVIRVGTHPEADELGVDAGAATACVLVFLETRTPPPRRDEAVRSLSTDATPSSGRRCGRQRARAANPPTPSGDTVASAPPAIITSASPYSIKRPAHRCMQPVVQAVTIARFGPWS